MRNIQLLQQLNTLHQNDPFVREIMNACGAVLDDNDVGILTFLHNQFFDTANEAGIRFYESEAEINVLSGQSLDDRKSAVSAKWRSGGKVTKAQLQTVADAWKNGLVEVDFINGKIQITFISVYGLPDDIKGLENALDEVKPAHLPFVYKVKYLLIEDVNAMTLEQLQTYTLGQFAGDTTI